MTKIVLMILGYDKYKYKTLAVARMCELVIIMLNCITALADSATLENLFAMQVGPVYFLECYSLEFIFQLVSLEGFPRT